MNEWKNKCVGLQRTWVSKRTVFGCAIFCESKPNHSLAFFFPPKSTWPSFSSPPHGRQKWSPGFTAWKRSSIAVESPRNWLCIAMPYACFLSQKPDADAWQASFPPPLLYPLHRSQNQINETNNPIRQRRYVAICRDVELGDSKLSNLLSPLEVLIPNDRLENLPPPSSPSWKRCL